MRCLPRMGAPMPSSRKVHNNVRQDALIALTTLGFDRARCDKAMDQIIGDSTEPMAVEALIKHALKRL